MKNTIKIAWYIKGVPVYDCNIFGGDRVKFERPVYITGDISLGDNADTGCVGAGGDVIFKDK